MLQEETGRNISLIKRIGTGKESAMHDLQLAIYTRFEVMLSLIVSSSIKGSKDEGISQARMKS